MLGKRFGFDLILLATLAVLTYAHLSLALALPHWALVLRVLGVRVLARALSVELTRADRERSCRVSLLIINKYNSLVPGKTCTWLWHATPVAAIPGVHQQLVAGGAGEEAAHRLGAARPLQAVKSLRCTFIFWSQNICQNHDIKNLCRQDDNTVVHSSLMKS